VVEVADLVEAVGRLRIARTGTGRPVRHQGLVLLWAIGRARVGAPARARWREVVDDLRSVFARYGDPDSDSTPQYPFVALHGGPFWELDEFTGAVPRAHGSAPLTWLTAQNPTGALRPEVRAVLADDRSRGRLVGALLNRFFDGERAVGPMLSALGVNRGEPPSALAPGDVARRAELLDHPAHLFEEVAAGVLQYVGGSRGGLDVVPAKLDVRVVDLEAHRTPSTTWTPGPAEITAERREAGLVRAYAEWLARRGGTTRAHSIGVPDQRHRLRTDLFHVEAGELIESKRSAGRADIRLALGQLLDYRRYVRPRRMAVLVPVRPADDLVNLLAEHGIGCVYPDGDGFARGSGSHPDE
jgi:hypothetical protein